MIGSILDDKVYTAEMCNQKCKEDVSDDPCTMFGVGRSDRSNYGKCFLTKGVCTKSTDVSYDIWYSTPKYPSKKPGVCTHLVSNMGSSATRDMCVAITSSTTC